MSDKEIIIDAKVRTIAEELKGIAELDTSTGLIKYQGAEDIFVKHLREGLTLDIVKQAQEETLVYAAAQTLATGELSNQPMKDNTGLTRTHAKETVGFARIDTVYDRKRSGSVKGTPWVKHGVADTDVILGVGRKATQYKDVVTYLGQQADAVFGD